MTGKIIIQSIRDAPLCWADKANEMISALNKNWEVKLPNDDCNLGSATVQDGQDKIVIDLSQLSLITFFGCDADGNMKKFTAFGYSEDIAP